MRELQPDSSLIGCTDRGRAGYPSDSSRAGREQHGRHTPTPTSSGAATTRGLRLRLHHHLASPPASPPPTGARRCRLCAVHSLSRLSRYCRKAGRGLPHRLHAVARYRAPGKLPNYGRADMAARRTDSAGRTATSRHRLPAVTRKPTAQVGRSAVESPSPCRPRDGTAGLAALGPVLVTPRTPCQEPQRLGRISARASPPGHHVIM